MNGQQETTWITDPTRFDVGNVDMHSLLLAPAERADVIVDFSQFAGKTLILYNDAPAAFPARVPSYDYYTGQPDLSPNGPAVVLPGYGPNTRTIMRVKIAAAAPAAAFNLTKLRNAFSHKIDGSGVFESSQHPIIVGQQAYNSAYGTSFSGGSDCNAVGSTLQICDGFVRVNDTAQFGFNTLKKPTTKTTLPLQPKAIHDEMNATTFDEFGRMQANLGVEAQPPTPGLQNVTLYPFVNPVTEIINGTNLPKNDVFYDANGNPVDDVKMQPMSTRRRRHPDLARHAQRRGHAPDPLPPLRRAAPQPRHVGQHHHPAGQGRARLEGHRPHGSARGHHRRPAAAGARAAVGDPELHPQPQPDGSGGLDQAASTASTCRATRCPRRSPTSSSTTAGATCGTATS